MSFPGPLYTATGNQFTELLNRTVLLQLRPGDLEAAKCFQVTAGARGTG